MVVGLNLFLILEVGMMLISKLCLIDKQLIEEPRFYFFLLFLHFATEYMSLVFLIILHTVRFPVVFLFFSVYTKLWSESHHALLTLWKLSCMMMGMAWNLNFINVFCAIVLDQFDAWVANISISMTLYLCRLEARKKRPFGPTINVILYLRISSLSINPLWKLFLYFLI